MKKLQGLVLSFILIQPAWAQVVNNEIKSTKRFFYNDNDSIAGVGKCSEPVVVKLPNNQVMVKSSLNIQYCREITTYLVQKTKSEKWTEWRDVEQKIEGSDKIEFSYEDKYLLFSKIEVTQDASAKHLKEQVAKDCELKRAEVESHISFFHMCDE